MGCRYERDVLLLERLQVSYEFSCFVSVFIRHRKEIGDSHVASNRYRADHPMVAFVAKRNLAPAPAVRGTPIRKRVPIDNGITVECEPAFLYVSGAKFDVGAAAESIGMV